VDDHATDISDFSCIFNQDLERVMLDLGKNIKVNKRRKREQID
jgi:hypothetical protein